MTYKHLLAASLATVVLAACQKDLKDATASRELLKKAGSPGAVYVLSNAATNNEVLVYDRSAKGELTWSAAYATGGDGSGGGLGSQGAVVTNENWLIAVNAGSNTISSFAITGQGLVWKDEVNSGGTRPISVDIRGDVVYALNAGGTGNIAGFHIDGNGMLDYIDGSSHGLSSDMSGPAQISFVYDNVLVVTEKMTNKIVSFTLSGSDVPMNMHMISSAHPTPFGFAVGSEGLIFVSEADGGNPLTSAVSSYKVEWDGMISLIEGPVLAGQTAACWVVITDNGKYVYATNTGSNTVSAFGSDASGDLSVLFGDVPAGTGTTPIDAALSNNSKFMYLLNASSHSIEAFSISQNGYPEYYQTVGGLPASAVGMAAK